MLENATTYLGVMLICLGLGYWVYLKSKEPPSEHWKEYIEKETEARLAWNKYERCKEERECDWPENCLPGDCRGWANHAEDVEPPTT